MRPSRRARPQVVTLEGRSLMSTAAPSTAAPEVAAHVRHHRVPSRPVVLDGRTTNLVIADRHGIAHVTGKGRFAGLGKVTISSSVDSKSETPLLSSPWLLYANVVVSTARGEINVRVTPGTIGLNPFAQPVHLQYAIHGGTGAYRHAIGKGLVDLTLGQAIPSTLSQLKQMGNQLDTKGIPFALHFHPGHLSKWGDFSGMWYKVIQGLQHKSGWTPAHHASHKAGTARSGSIRR
jgi:hypothetical protein